MNDQVKRVRMQQVTPNESGQRLDNWLMRELKNVPRTLVYKVIRKGQVRVNGRRAKPMQKLVTGDEVRIPPVNQLDRGPPAVPEERIAEIRSRIIENDKHFLVIDKPGGLAVHSGSGIRWGAIDLVRAMPGYEDCQLGHRLDRETSGCLVIARSRESLLVLQEALKVGEVTKKYLCLLRGDIPEPVTVDVPLSRSQKAGEQVTVVDPDGKRAVTHIRPLERRRRTTLCEVEIETGRTHQIRVHAAHLGHPVVGDARYGRGGDGLRLHCSFMAFDWEERGYSLSASAPIPEDWR